MAQVKCLLCDQEADGQVVEFERKDRYIIECPRCARYVFDRITIPHVLNSKAVKDRRFVISGFVRTRENQKEPLFDLTEEMIYEILDTAPVPQSAHEYVDNLLLHLTKGIDRPWHSLVIQDEDYPLLYMRSKEDLHGFLYFAKELGFLVSPVHSAMPWGLTMGGWERIESLRSALPDSQQAFVAMSFDKSLDGAYDDGIKKGIEDSGFFTAVRVDRQHHLGKIDDWIISQIRRSGLVVADFTLNRAGVYFEAGFALALGLPVVFSCQEDSMKHIHFDTNHFNHVVWQGPEDLRKKLDDRIRASVLPEVAKRKS